MKRHAFMLHVLKSTEAAALYKLCPSVYTLQINYNTLLLPQYVLLMAMTRARLVYSVGI